MEVSYKPPADFEVDSLQPLVDIDLSGSKELWLIQCPMNQFPEIDGKELKVKLDKEAVFGGIEDSSGKEFDIVSFASQDVGATVIIPSGAESKIVGKISRRVSLVRYPDPFEVVEAMASKAQQRLTGALTSSSNQFSTPIRSNHSASARSSRHLSTVSGMASKRKYAQSIGKSNISGSSGKPHSSMTGLSGSSDRSEKSKKKMKSHE